MGVKCDSEIVVAKNLYAKRNMYSTTGRRSSFKQSSRQFPMPSAAEVEFRCCIENYLRYTENNFILYPMDFAKFANVSVPHAIARQDLVNTRTARKETNLRKAYWLN